MIIVNEIQVFLSNSLYENSEAADARGNEAVSRCAPAELLVYPEWPHHDEDAEAKIQQRAARKERR